MNYLIPLRKTILKNIILMEHFYQKIPNWFDWPSLYKNMVDKFDDNSHFVEIGSFKGGSSVFMAVEIINSGKNIKFDCVDLWNDFWDNDLKELNSNIVYLNMYETFLNNIKPVSHIINPIRSDSHSAASLYDDNSLNFLYIDANHHYDYIKKDLQLWYPKMKKGGIFAGHDFINNEKCQVQRAVEEFCRIYKLNVNLEEGGSWLIDVK
jgi:cephalosporin hydroxylase